MQYFPSLCFWQTRQRDPTRCLVICGDRSNLFGQQMTIRKKRKSNTSTVIMFSNIDMLLDRFQTQIHFKVRLYDENLHIGQKSYAVKLGYNEHSGPAIFVRYNRGLLLTG